MPLDSATRKRLERALLVVDQHDTRGPRLLDDAKRLWRQVEQGLAEGLIPPTELGHALEAACYGLQLPARNLRALPAGRLGRTNLKDRAEQAAELLVGLLGSDEELADAAGRILRELPSRSGRLEESRLLADAVNLEDFGVSGLFQQAIVMARQGGGVMQILEGSQKRDLYRYWEARLKEGFHFAPMRAEAEKRLAAARQVIALLHAEITRE